MYQASTERLYPAGAMQAKQKSAQKQSIDEAKAITRCITAGRPADFYLRIHPYHRFSTPPFRPFCQLFQNIWEVIYKRLEARHKIRAWIRKVLRRHQSRKVVKSLQKSFFFKDPKYPNHVARCLFCKPSHLNSEEMDCCSFPNVNKRHCEMGC